MYRTELTCPVCGAIMDIHKHREKDPGGYATAITASGCRQAHLKESPECKNHPDWIKGWNLSEPVKIDD